MTTVDREPVRAEVVPLHGAQVEPAKPSRLQLALKARRERGLPSKSQLVSSARWWWRVGLPALGLKLLDAPLDALQEGAGPIRRGFARAVNGWSAWRSAVSLGEAAKVAEPGKQMAEILVDRERKRVARARMSVLALLLLTAAVAVAAVAAPGLLVIAGFLLLMWLDILGRQPRPDAPLPPPRKVLLAEGVPMRQLTASICEILDRELGQDAAVGVETPMAWDQTRQEYRVVLSSHYLLESAHVRAVERGIGAADHAARLIGTDVATNRVLIIRRGDPLAVAPTPPWIDSGTRSIVEPLDLGASVTDVPLALTFAGAHVAVVGMTGCLAADTTILVNRAGNAKPMRIADLVTRFNRVGITDKRLRWRLRIPTRVQREVDGLLRLGELSAAWSSGRQTTYQLTTSVGRTIRATAQHPFLTPRGWVRLGDLSVGDDVVVRGQQGQDAPPVVPKRWYRAVSGLRGHPYAFRGEGRPRFVVDTHRLVAEARLNQLPLDVYVARLKAGKINGLSFVDPKVYHVHHINNEPLDNAPENLEVLTLSEHLREHNSHERVLYKTTTETVAAIELYGDEETYDLEIADDPHNYVANGFVVHNSGKSKSFLWAAIDRVSACRDAVIWGIDLAAGPTLPMWRGVIQKSAYTPEQAAALLVAALAEIARRMHVLKDIAEDDDPNNDVDSWHSGLGPALVIVIDELSLTVDYDGTKGKLDLLHPLEEIIRLGRKVWVHLVLGTQRTGNSDFGSTVMSTQVGVKILMACSERDTTTMLSTAHRDRGWSPHHLKPAVEGDSRDAGKCYVDGPSHRTPDIYRCYAPLTPGEVKSRARQRMADGLPQLERAGAGEDVAVEVPAIVAAVEQAFHARNMPAFMPSRDLVAWLRDNGWPDLTEQRLAERLGQTCKLRPSDQRQRVDGSNPLRGYAWADVEDALRRLG